MSKKKNLQKYGIAIPSILLPKDKSKLKSWSVIACDQYTQDAAYWQNVENFVGDAPSSLHITLPEIYLNASDKNERIASIKSTMKKYIDEKLFEDEGDAFVYIERKTAYGRKRSGLVLAIDLECYEWKPFSQSLIRATEATILDRIPPRKEIRQNAAIETPHIMLLVDDPEKKLVEKLGEKTQTEAPLYQTDLMMDSGSITAWKIHTEKQFTYIEETLAELAQQNKQKDGSVFLFAVGDGNHSLATAKAVWDSYKTEQNLSDHPARYALVEIVNIYDAGLTFEPIHRVIFDIDGKELLAFCQKELGGEILFCENEAELTEAVENSSSNFGFVYNHEGKICYALLKNKSETLAVSRLQPVLDSYLEIHAEKNPEIDYIHGNDEVFRLGGKNTATSILLPPIAKDSFFSSISNNGPLPRKSFSMGEASEKRFYMECRKLFS